ncbi:MAG: tetratricopeptide repeat protein [Bacteroidetes bacterium]|nr:tetratricopeptide repeat protein [Bacteroidota bacterium]
MKAPQGAMNTRRSSQSESKSSWYTPLLAFYLQSRRLLTVMAIGIVLIIAGIVGYNYIQDTRNTQAQEFLGGILLEYERSNYRIALDGSGDILGLTDIVARYGSTPAGNTARFYAANAHFELNEFDLALEHFTDYKASDDFLGASAIAGRAAILELQGEYLMAADLFRRAAGMDDDNVIRAPYYLRSAARAYVESGELDSAKEVILEAKENYPETDLLDEFNYMLGMVLARQS